LRANESFSRMTVCTLQVRYLLQQRRCQPSE
jgi:hypothetical protein